MVIKGRSRSNGAQLADYLLNSRSNDNARIIDIRGTAKPDSLRKSLLEMSLSSELTKRGTKGLYHSQINPAIGEDRPMTYDDWLRAADILEQSLGFEGQKRVFVLHEKNGRTHGHVVWERYDHDTGKLRTDSKNYKKHDQARARMEQEFGHERTPQKAAREPTHKERLSDLWQQHPDGESFVRAAQEAGYTVGQGNARRPFRVITPDGQSLDLTRQLDGVKVKEVRERLNPIRATMPTEADALQQSKDGRTKAAEPQKTAPEQSDNLREMSDSQDLFNAMANRVKQRSSDKKPDLSDTEMSYGFSFNQTLKTPAGMRYDQLIERQQEELNRLHREYTTARTNIQNIQNGHFNARSFDKDLERLEAKLKQDVEAATLKHEAQKQDYLQESPTLPRDPEQKRDLHNDKYDQGDGEPTEAEWQAETDRYKSQSDKKQDLSDITDKANDMLKQARQQAQQTTAKQQEPVVHTHPITGQPMTPEAYEKYRLFMDRQAKREQGRKGHTPGLEP